MVHLVFAHLVFTLCGQPVFEFVAFDFNFMWPTIQIFTNSKLHLLAYLVIAISNEPNPTTVLYRGSVLWQLDGSLAGRVCVSVGILWSISFVTPWYY